MARVWPGTVVEEGNLKVHIAALRPTLADGQAGRRYLATIPGRGCRFVAPVVLTEEPTLREPLCAAGGHVERRAPEESFPAWLRPSTDEALSFPSVQMFVERAAVTCSAMWARRSLPTSTASWTASRWRSSWPPLASTRS
jgi:DNA-binding winged helix-turn-helix (wHTH) protein